MVRSLLYRRDDGCALGFSAIKNGYSVLYKRCSRLFGELSIARADGRYHKVLQQLLRTELLIIDDFGINALNKNESADLMEVLEDRSERRSTLVTSQLPVKEWHHVIDDPTLGDAIMDRLTH